MDLNIIDFFVEFIVFCTQLFLWIALGLVIYFIFLYRKVQKRMVLVQRNTLKTLVHVVIVEKYGDQYYWFDKDDDTFIAQGKNDDEIIEKLKKDFSNHKFFLQESDKMFQLSGPKWVFEPFQLP